MTDQTSKPIPGPDQWPNLPSEQFPVGSVTPPAASQPSAPQPATEWNPSMTGYATPAEPSTPTWPLLTPPQSSPYPHQRLKPLNTSPDPVPSESNGKSDSSKPDWVSLLRILMWPVGFFVLFKFGFWGLVLYAVVVPNVLTWARTNFSDRDKR